MGRKKSSEHWDSTKVDSLMDEMYELATDHYGKGNVFDSKEAENRIVGLPLPSLACRYLLQSTVWPLTRMTQLVGTPGCGKSTLLDEIFRWHRKYGGRNILMEAEDKDNADQRNAVLNYDDKAVLIHPCEYLEDWQEGLVFFIKKYKDLFTGNKTDPGPGRVAPICFGVDSIMGKAAKEVQEKVKKEGYAQRGYALEANLISIFMKCMPQMIANWPFSVVGVNHWKPSQDKQGRPTGTVSGGSAPKFQETYRLLLSKVRQFTKAKFEGYTVQIKTDKNSLGPDKKSIYVDVIWWYEMVETAQTLTEEELVAGEISPTAITARQHTIWNWEAASISTLLSFAAKRAGLFKQLMNICDLHVDRKHSGRVWSNTLDIPSTDTLTFREAGKILETRLDVLSALYPILGIKERTPFQPGLDYQLQQEQSLEINKMRELTHRVTSRVSEKRSFENQNNGVSSDGEDTDSNTDNISEGEF